MTVLLLLILYSLLVLSPIFFFDPFLFFLLIHDDGRVMLIVDLGLSGVLGLPVFEIPLFIGEERIVIG